MKFPLPGHLWMLLLTGSSLSMSMLLLRSTKTRSICAMLRIFQELNGRNGFVCLAFIRLLDSPIHVFSYFSVPTANAWLGIIAAGILVSELIVHFVGDTIAARITSLTIRFNFSILLQGLPRVPLGNGAQTSLQA